MEWEQRFFFGMLLVRNSKVPTPRLFQPVMEEIETTLDGKIKEVEEQIKF
jgi:hypothetical protein